MSRDYEQIGRKISDTLRARVDEDPEAYSQEMRERTERGHAARWTPERRAAAAERMAQARRKVMTPEQAEIVREFVAGRAGAKASFYKPWRMLGARLGVSLKTVRKWIREQAKEK